MARKFSVQLFNCLALEPPVARHHAIPAFKSARARAQFKGQQSAIHGPDIRILQSSMKPFPQ